jgi:hypothetical protein
MRELRRLIGSLEARLAQRELADAAKVKRLEEQAARTKEIPSTAEIVASIEELLSRTTAGWDERLALEAQSIEILRTTVSHTDSLLERVLESLDSLEPEGEPAVVISRSVLEKPSL